LYEKLNWVPGHYTCPFVFKACGEISNFELGGSIHGSIFRSGFDSNVFVCNVVVSMYGKCKPVVDARKVFDELCHRGICDSVSWNSIVSVYSHCFVPNVAVSLFREDGLWVVAGGCWCC
jgi:pentatricopeptide repeat protein